MVAGRDDHAREDPERLFLAAALTGGAVSEAPAWWLSSHAWLAMSCCGCARSGPLLAPSPPEV